MAALVGPNPGPSWKVVGTGDFNGDGRSDILWQNANGQASIWEMNGTNVIGGGTRRSQSRARVGKRSGRATLTAMAFPISCGRTRSGQASVWEMNGTNQIAGGSQLVGPNPGSSWHVIAA